MSGGFYPDSGVCNVTDIGAVTASTTGTTVPIGTGVYGAWTQLSASAPADCTFVIANASFLSVPTFSAIWEIGVGGAGSEVVVAAGLSLGPWNGSSSEIWQQSAFPFTIPAGARVSAAAKGNSGDTAKIKLAFLDGAFANDGITGYGEIGVASNVTPSATANTKGSYVQVTASTARDYAGLQIGIDSHNANPNAYMIDIAIGGSGSEIPVLSNMMFIGNTINFPPIYIPVEIPAGTRIATRCQCAAASANAIANIYFAGAYR